MSEGRSVILRYSFLSFFLFCASTGGRETREKVYIARRVVFVVLSKDARLVRGIDLSLASN